jgi:hypothetical protein
MHYRGRLEGTGSDGVKEEVEKEVGAQRKEDITCHYVHVEQSTKMHF